MRDFSAYYKYAYYLMKFGTARKLNNILLNRKEFKQNKTELKSRPYKITIDPGNICNLRCPGCHTGIKHPEMIKPSFLSLKDYQVMLPRVQDYALSIALYNWGEPFLNREIFDIIAHTKENRIGTTVHSNFNKFNEEMAINAVKSGLTHIYLSIDGANQEAYVKYRVKGHLDTVTDNVKMMLETRKRLKSKFPIITWKYLIFEHNAHEVKMAAKKAKALGVDSFEVFTGSPKLMDIYDEAEQYKDNPALLHGLQDKCRSLWSSLYVNANGSVLPCSLAYRENEKFGNLIQNDLSDIWNNEYYTNARKMFSGNEVKNIPLPCNACKYSLKGQCN